jgi:hypothetical protein
MIVAIGLDPVGDGVGDMEERGFFMLVFGVLAAVPEGVGVGAGVG